MDIPQNAYQSDLVYKNTPQRDLQLTFLPPLEEKCESAPVYFLITGGGWCVEKRHDVMVFLCSAIEGLRQKGFAVVSIDYRVYPEGVSIREIITDCFDAARYIAHFADVLKIDKQNFYLSGHSAGAHLALMVSYAPQNMFVSDYEFRDTFAVKAVAAISPPTILYDKTTHNLGKLSELFPMIDTQEEREYASPISYVSNNCPPTLLCAGTSDWVVFSNSSEKLYKKLKEYNVYSQLMLSVCGGHMFEQVHDIVTPSITAEEMQKGIIDFALEHISNI